MARVKMHKTCFIFAVIFKNKMTQKGKVRGQVGSFFLLLRKQAFLNKRKEKKQIIFRMLLKILTFATISKCAELTFELKVSLRSWNPDLDRENNHFSSLTYFLS